jgi:protein MAK16
MLNPGPKIVSRMAPKLARREETKERKALAAAKLEKQIEKELVSRLKSGNYTEDMLNVYEEVWKRVLDQRARAERGEVDEEEELEVEEDVQFVSDDEGIMSGDEEFNDWLAEDKEMESEVESEVDSDLEETEVEGKENWSPVVMTGRGKSLVSRWSMRRNVRTFGKESSLLQDRIPNFIASCLP